MAEEHIDSIIGGSYNDSLFDNTRDSDTGIWYRVKGFGTDFFVQIVRMIWSMVQQAKLCKQFRIYVDDVDTDLQFSITAGKMWYGGTLVSYGGALAQALTASQTNYISILLPAGTIDINTSSFPAADHFRIGTIVATTTWDIQTDLTDMRQESLFRAAGTIKYEEMEALSDLMKVVIPDASGTSPRTVQLQVQTLDGVDSDQVEYVAVSVHADVDGDDMFDTDATIAIGTAGSLIKALVTDKELYAKTNASGELDIDVTKGTTGTVYVMARPFRRNRILNYNDISTVEIS